MKNVRLSIVYRDKTYDVPYDGTQTILSAALAQDVPVNWGCLYGHCGDCLAQVIDGATDMIASEYVTEDEVRAGQVLICQARVVGSHCCLKMLK